MLAVFDCVFITTVSVSFSLPQLSSYWKVINMMITPSRSPSWSPWSPSLSPPFPSPSVCRTCPLIGRWPFCHRGHYKLFPFLARMGPSLRIPFSSTSTPALWSSQPATYKNIHTQSATSGVGPSPRLPLAFPFHPDLLDRIHLVNIWRKTCVTKMKRKHSGFS